MKLDEDLGTVRWFGDSWGAPVCDPRTKVPTPVGKFCLACRVKIEAGDQGVTIPYSRSKSGNYEGVVDDWIVSDEPHHLVCFQSEIGMPVGRNVAAGLRRPLTRLLALDLREQHWTIGQIAEEYDRDPSEVEALLHP